jgi:hypothetical protein
MFDKTVARWEENFAKLEEKAKLNHGEKAYYAKQINSAEGQKPIKILYAIALVGLITALPFQAMIYSKTGSALYLATTVACGVMLALGIFMVVFSVRYFRFLATKVPQWKKALADLEAAEKAEVFSETEDYADNEKT